MNKKESLPLKSIDALYACERVFKTWNSRKNVNTNTETSTALIGEFLCSRWDSSSTGASNGGLSMMTKASCAILNLSRVRYSSLITIFSAVVSRVSPTNFSGQNRKCPNIVTLLEKQNG
ncbi:Thiol-specific monooxygenase [Fusarium oxysporum f. sp. albedinis]|nr:Thiol-specific monooxygenase [Fusarium oxysporum f. sp. albedinis]